MEIQATPRQLLDGLRRIEPYPGMMIDAQIWRDAHEYHRELLRLHHLNLHGWGLVRGLEITVDGDQNTLRIEPGIAIDPVGNFVTVADPQGYPIMSRQRGVVYLVLQLRDIPLDAAPAPYVMEAYRLQERDRPPDEPYLELARIDFDPGAGCIRMPARAEEPGLNELDLRHRVMLTTDPLPGRPPGQLGDSNGARLAGGDTSDASLVASAVQELARQLSSLEQRVEAVTGYLHTTGSHPAGPIVDSVPQDSTTRQRPDTAGLVEIIKRTDLLAGELHVLSDHVVALEAARAAQQDTGSTALSQAQSAMSQVDVLGGRLDGLGQDLDRLSDTVSRLHSRPVATSSGSATLRRHVRLAIARHATPGWDAHSEGVRCLARELEIGTPGVSMALVDGATMVESDQLDVLYVTGHDTLTLGDAEVSALRALLDRGGVVVGEGCAGGPKGEQGAREFDSSLFDLARRLDRQFTGHLERPHPLLTVRCIFGTPPIGVRDAARVAEADGFVCSVADYGCAWQGGPAGKPLSRSAIRDALEFGVNMALYRQPIS
jgi:hypothetical protein